MAPSERSDVRRQLVHDRWPGHPVGAFPQRPRPARERTVSVAHLRAEDRCLPCGTVRRRELGRGRDFSLVVLRVVDARHTRTSLRRRRDADRHAYGAHRAAGDTPETSGPVSPPTRDLRVGCWRLNMTFEGSSYVSTTGALSMPVDRWDAVLPEELLTRLTRQHPNILLVGPATFTEAAIRLIEPIVQHPIAWWMP